MFCRFRAFPGVLLLFLCAFPTAARAGPTPRHASPDSQYAMGVRLMTSRSFSEAIDVFERVLKLNRTHLGALCRLGDVYLAQGRLGKARDAYDRALEADQGLAEAHYGLGMADLMRREGTERAAEHLSRAAALRPGYSDAKIALGKAYRGLGRHREALTTLAEVLRDAPGDQVRCLPEIALTYLASGDFESAAETFRVYLPKLPSPERALYQDISLVASAGEMAALTETSPEQVADFTGRFWRKRDPTPTTPVNERLVEHYRRVYFARQHFSQGAMPWDRRGEVYIRYGDPDHRSRSDDIALETDPRVKRVKDRLVTQAREGLYEITAPQLAPTVELRGIPVFPLKQDDAWEYWIYADLAGGIEVVFVDEFRSGKYEYAPIPLQTGNPVLWERLLPARTVDRAVHEAPDRYPFDPGPVLEFYYDVATFRGRGGKTRLEVAWGVPGTQLGVSPGGVVGLERGIALLDRTWGEVGHLLEEADFRASSEMQSQAGALLVDSHGLEVVPGTYHLAVSARDRLSGRTGLYRQEVSVEGYPDHGLLISDVLVAGTLLPEKEGKFVRHGTKVVPMPSRAFRRSQEPGFYFEVYNLAAGGDRRTRYRVDYTLSSLSRQAIVARILTGRGEGRRGDLHLGERIVTSFEQSGDLPEAVHHVQINLQGSEPGRYALTVTVRDLNSQEQVSRRAEFTITE